MNKYFPLAGALVLALATLCLGQTEAAKPTASASPSPRPAMSNTQLRRNLVAMEKKLWEAWKNKDAKPFRSSLSADALLVGDTGLMNKEATIKEISENDCVVNSYELSDFKLVRLNSDSALLTYKGTQDGTCGGQTLPAAVWATSAFVRRGGRWLNAYHQESPAK
jgi:hypothetical protein